MAGAPPARSSPWRTSRPRWTSRWGRIWWPAALSVRQHLVADVPLGVFLSGGVDSATVAAIARGHTTGRIQTFSIGFEERSFDESAHARVVAETLGTEHHEHIVGPREVLDLVDGLAELVDEPLGDASILPTFVLSRFA